eukprot:3914313-Pyramimonas_sp.AAC.1
MKPPNKPKSSIVCAGSNLREMPNVYFQQPAMNWLSMAADFSDVGRSSFACAERVLRWKAVEPKAYVKANARTYLNARVR